MYIISKNGVNIFLHLACIHLEQNNGCKNRSLQLYEMFSDNGWKFEKIDTPTFSKWKTFFNGLAVWFQLGIFKPFGINSLRSAGQKKVVFLDIQKRFPRIQTFIFEGTGFGEHYSFRILKKMGKRVILIPANIESLAPYTDVWTHKLSIEKRLIQEIAWLKDVDHVYTISLEEQWLLSVFGIKSSFLSYYPPKYKIEEIERIIKIRSLNKEKKGWIYVGNFNNEPNVLGLKKLVESFRVTPSQKKIFVIGINISKVIQLIENNNNFEIIGELSDDELFEYYTRSEGVVLYHHPSSGTLTRVIEYLLMGIPIDGNLAALKSYYLISQGNLDTAIHESFLNESKFFFNNILLD